MNLFARNTELIGMRKSGSLIICDDGILDIILEDPTKPLVLPDKRGFSTEERPYDVDMDSLVDKLRKAKEQGAEIFHVSYDYFFGGETRDFFPESEKTVKAFKVIHDLAKEYGMGFSASIINPLDTGGEQVMAMEDGGFTWHYQEGEILPDGSFSVDLDQQLQWVNNKGPMYLTLDHLVVYAFQEERIGDSNYYYVDPEGILDISESAVRVERCAPLYCKRGYGRQPITIKGKWEAPVAGYDRCLAVAVYRTREIDYFSPEAFTYLKGVVDKHAAAGITYQEFYSDEMHIQFDWGIDDHFGLTEVTTRYMTKHMAREYARRYGAEYEDLFKYLVYFSYHQHDFLPGEEGKLPSQHVMGRDAEGIYRTWLLRKRYFELLNHRVVELCNQIKDYAEGIFGGPIHCLAHATWMEAPTNDRHYKEARFTELRDEKYSHYDYHPDYYFSSSITQAMAACYDYFAWNDFLTCGGSDHAEEGYSDRNYYANAFGTSLQELNKFHFGYAGTWGSPDEIARRFSAVGRTYGMGGFSSSYGERMVQNFYSRVTDLLVVYPLDLLYPEERFGSWMVQYGYCNYISEQKLLEYGKLLPDGRIQVKENIYRGLAMFFSPFATQKLVDFAKGFVEAGGKLLWMSMPPALCDDTSAPAEGWKELFGIASVAGADAGKKAFRDTVTFLPELGMEEMEIPTDMLPDWVYSVVPGEGRVLATWKGAPIAVEKQYPSGGRALYAGFRVRDDQSASMGKDISTLFDLLNYMGVYSADGGEILSRPADSRYVINRFANGTVAVANHYRTFYEHWDGLFYRIPERDAEYLKGRELPPINLEFAEADFFGRKITYSGTDSLNYCVSPEGELTGFAGYNTTGITIDGKGYTFLEQPGAVCFGLLDSRHLQEGLGNGILLQAAQAGRVTLPNLLHEEGVRLYSCPKGVYADMEEIPAAVTGEQISLEITEELQNVWILACRK